jgi:hypothetical protein
MPISSIKALVHSSTKSNPTKVHSLKLLRSPLVYFNTLELLFGGRKDTDINEKVRQIQRQAYREEVWLLADEEVDEVQVVRPLSYYYI